jgi:hypothetical protein
MEFLERNQSPSGLPNADLSAATGSTCGCLISSHAAERHTRAVGVLVANM